MFYQRQLRAKSVPFVGRWHSFGAVGTHRVAQLPGDWRTKLPPLRGVLTLYFPVRLAHFFGG